MIAVLFEAYPFEGRWDEYFDLGAVLKSDLVKMDGFVSVERYQSITEPGKFLSVSFWRDEEAITQWRNLAAHREAQAKGMNILFSDYRIRVAQVVRDYGKNDRSMTPTDSQTIHAPHKPIL